MAERTAKFTLNGFVAARTAEAGQRTVDALQKISMTIIEAYKAANESAYSRDQKMSGLQKVVNLLPELEWLEKFTADEAQFCKVPQERLKLTEAYKDIAGKVNLLKQEFRILRQSGENFPLCFNTILQLLDVMTGFMQTGHGAGVANAQDMAKGVIQEADGLLNCEYANVLVNAAKQTSVRFNEAVAACQSLINTQDEDERGPLQSMLDSCDDRGRAALQDLILKTKAVFQGQGSKDAQKQAHGAFVAVLKEIHAIEERIKANYNSAFDVSEARRRLQLQASGADASKDTRMAGDLLQAAKDMAAALGAMHASLDKPPEKVPVPKLAMFEPESKRSAKGDLIVASQKLEQALGGVTRALDK